MEWFARLTELPQDWNCLIQRRGWKRALPQIGEEIIALPYRRIKFVVVARSLLEPLPDLKPKIPVTVRPFEPADLGFVRQERLPSEVRLCIRRLELGHHGLVACIDGAAAGYA